jgi:hypothetical protein
MHLNAVGQLLVDVPYSVLELASWQEKEKPALAFSGLLQSALSNIN